MSLRTLTIVKTDVRGFTSRSGRMSSAELDEFLISHRQAVVRLMQAWHGTIVKEIGDSFLVTFSSSTEAVLACIELQRQLAATPTPGLDESRVEVRISVSAGDVLLQEGDVFGTAVNLAARLEAVTPPGEIYVTEAAYHNMNHNEVAAELIGPFSFKGIDGEVNVYRTTFQHQTRTMRCAVLMTDIEGFTRFAETAPLAAVERVLEAWERIHRVVAESHDGVVRHIVGNVQMLTFDSVSKAIDAWREVCGQVSDFNGTGAEFSIRFRAGVDFGEVRVFRSAMYGRALANAEALSNVAPTGHLLVRKEVVGLGGADAPLHGLVSEPLEPRILGQDPRFQELAPIQALRLAVEIPA